MTLHKPNPLLTLGRYLAQPMLDPSQPPIWNPLRFWHHCRQEYLEGCYVLPAATPQA
jgi:uracil-DNA glycosylase